MIYSFKLVVSILILCFIFNSLILLVNASSRNKVSSSVLKRDVDNDDYDDSEVSGSTSGKNCPMNDAGKCIEDEDEDGNGPCSFDSLSESAKKYLPDDYEEGQNMEPKRRVDHLNETMAVLNRLEQMGRNFSRKLEPKSKRIMSQIMDLFYSIDLPNECMTSIAKIGQAIQNGETWAMKFFDSQPAMPKGILEGIRTTFGEYDMCMSIESPPQQEMDGKVIKGHYCLSKIVIPYPENKPVEPGEPFDDILTTLAISVTKEDETTSKSTKKEKKTGFQNPPKDFINTLIQGLHFEKGAGFRFGLCLPSTCRPEDVQRVINSVVYPLLHLPIQVGPDCDYKDKPFILNTHQWIAIITFSTLITCVISGTILEYLLIKKAQREYLPSPGLTEPTKSMAFLLAFSAISNAKTLWAPARKLACIDGIRLFFAVWIVLVHAYVFTCFNSQSIKRLMAGVHAEMLIELKYTWVRNLHIVDFFFLIGGLVLCYAMLPKMEKSLGNFSYISYVVLRYIRLIPAVLCSIFIFWLFPIILNGPVANEVMNKLIDGCHLNWHHNILFINNYYASFPEPVLCNPPTWSLAADFHLYIVAPFFLAKLIRNPKNGLIWCSGGILLGIVFSVAPKYYGINSYYEWRSFSSGSDLAVATRWHFYGTHVHLSPFFMGLMLGYLLRKNPDIHLGGKVGETILWLVCLSSSFIAMFWHWNWFRDEPDQVSLYAYLSVARIMWTSGWAWTIFACSTGRAERLNKVLSWNKATPWSRLTMGVFLLHTLPIMYRISCNKYEFVVTDYWMVTATTFDFILSIFMAFIFYLVVECPVGNLVQIFLMPPQRPPSRPKIGPQKGQGDDLKQSVTISNNDTIITRL